MSTAPKPNGQNGRDEQGRFTRGNPGGPGNPHAAQVAKLRSTLLRSVRQKDLRAVVKKLIEQAKAGDTVAARELLDRVLGRPVEADLIERLEELEDLVVRTVEAQR